MSDSKLTTLASGKQLFIDLTPSTSALAARPTIIFLHGLGSSSSFYEAPFAVSKLAASHRLVRYDFDGHGLSPVSGREVSIESLVEDLKSVMEHVGCAKAGVVGHSMSGLVALTFAAKYPAMVDQLFLIGPVKAMPPAGAAAMHTRAATVRTSGLSAIAPLIASSAISAHSRATSPLSLALIRALVLPTPIEGYARACEALAKGTDPDFAKIEAELLVVGGEEDYMSTRDVISAICGAVKRGRSVEMENVGHWHAIEQPAKLAEIMDDFFKV